MKELPILRNSERGDFKACPQKWHWRWNEHLIPAMPKQDALWFGTLWHLLWATVYTPPGKDGFERAIKDPVQIHQLWNDLTKDAYTSVAGQPYWGDDEELEWNDACSLGHVMIDGQIKEWNLDPHLEVLMPEQRFRMKIPYTQDQLSRLDGRLFPDTKFITLLTGTYDLPARDHSDPGSPQVKILDWKTTSRRTNQKDLNKDDQAGTYLFTATTALRSMGMIKPDEAVEYMIFSFARKAKPPEQTKDVDDQGRIRNKPQKNHYMLALGLSEADVKGLTIAKLEDIAQGMTPPIKVYGEVSKNQGSPLFWREIVRRNKANRSRQLRRIAEDAEMIAMVRGGDLPILKNPGDHCNWCQYTDLCDLDEDGGDTEGFIKYMFKKDDPYADHREGAVNSKVLK